MSFLHCSCEHHLKEMEKRLMAAIDDLNAAIATLSTDVTAEVAALAAAVAKQGGTPDAEVETAVANLKALSTQLAASVAPPATTTTAASTLATAPAAASTSTPPAS